MTEKKPDHIFIQIEGGKTVCYDNDMNIWSVLGENDSLTTFEKAEADAKFDEYLLEHECRKAQEFQNHPRREEIETDMYFSMDEGEYERMKNDPFLYTKKFSEALGAYGPSDEEQITAKKDQEKTEKRLRALEKKIKAMDAQGHSTSDLLSKYQEFKGHAKLFEPDLDL